jgi:hypothetical protein
MRIRLCAPVLLVALAAPLGAAAQPTGDPTRAAALFQEGREAAKKGDHAGACPKLAESYRIDPAVGTLLNLADCNEHLGKVATAWQLFQQAIEHLPNHDDRVPMAKKRIAALAARLSRLTLVLAAGAPAGTKVIRDAAELAPGSLDTPLPIDPGAHEVIVKAPDREDRRFEFTVAERETKRLELEPGPPTPPPTPTQPEPGMSPMRLSGIIVGGVGIVGLAAAIGTGLALPGKQRTIKLHCGPPVHPANVCDAVGFEAAQAGKTLSAANTAAWVVGIAATSAGVGLVVLGGFLPKRDSALQLTVSPGLAGASIEGRF